MRSLPSRWVELGKHQAAAFVATVVDFLVMVALVELASMAPSIATVFSAACGAVS